MRDEVRAAGLLRQSERQSGREAQCQSQPRQPRVSLAKNKVWGEQRVAGAGMRRGKAAANTQCVGSVGEQLDVREAAAECSEVPWAVDVRQRLEQADRAHRQQDRHREKDSGSAQGAPVALDKCRDPERQRQRNHGADSPASAGVNQLVRHPGVAADPLRSCGIEEHGARDVLVERRDSKNGRRHDEDCERDLQVRPPEPQGLHAIQNDRRVSMRSCMPSMSLLRSSGKARSMCSTLPSPERALPRRRPRPTSRSQPADAAA